jgi:hypothetical protein
MTYYKHYQAVVLICFIIATFLVIVAENGENWHIARKRESYDDHIRDELLN